MNRTLHPVFSHAAAEAAASNGNVERAIGQEWIVDAFGCVAKSLADPESLRQLLEALIAELGLQPLAPGVWHRFPSPGGVTGMYLLSESHLTCHTWPEHGRGALHLC